MEMRMLVQGKKNPPVLNDIIIPPVSDLSRNPEIIFVVVEGGMTSGEPSVLIVSRDASFGTVVLNTSLDKFVAGAVGMMSAAEKRWGWKQPEGHATLMPMDREARRALAEALKKELEEWDGLDGG